ncbi:PTS transporter subunit EIIC [Mycoplasma mycoides]|uniref:PTS transporter subunit EIIC n=1 Tax=Mycoplasma mycoides TaxID=2102 RepID=UPI00273623D2|nr:PTS transporter subunit EIIC [Mycoplasma mycoides]MDP4040414.1 PTS transporter subunit EIIC [Mycoplasma mycoides]MDP4041540.1 PTS transporter subunit EIIC [Mycoplasma mycoides]MDP4042261.1 PTS transporter subunit EIIC [Mycoplasma mycoides]MDP4043663.1 PTS transporter subunit EIIC [Mycoplasma mycoides]MDP4044501.1 PTS transporter subunit EIIC [Mycoplasma mycoides]
MTKQQKQLALIEEIFINVGGKQNIKDVYNCATRLRLTLYDQSLIKLDNLKTLKRTQGCLISSGELQIIIGSEVSQITNLLKEQLQVDIDKINGFEIRNSLNENNKKVGLTKRFVKSISAIFGPLIPFLIGFGLIMALQQILIRIGWVHSIKSDSVFQKDYNVFDLVINTIANSGFKLIGVMVIWSTTRYLKGNTAIAIALGLIMISPIIPEQGLHLLNIGSWEIVIKPFYSTILVFIFTGVVISYFQKLMNKYFHSVANFILNPLLSLLIGGLLAFFVIGPIMSIIESYVLKAFNWFVTLPYGISGLIIGLTWQPLVVLGVHNVLFFTAVADLTTTNNPSIFLAAAFAAAWAQMGATIAVGIKSKKSVDKSAAIAAALPGIISGPTESCIYAINLPRFKPFILGTIAGGIGGWLISIFNVGLNNLAGLGGIVGFLAYTDKLVLAIIIDLASFVLGILITYVFWNEQQAEEILFKNITKELKIQTGHYVSRLQNLLVKLKIKKQQTNNNQTEIIKAYKNIDLMCKDIKRLSQQTVKYEKLVEKLKQQEAKTYKIKSDILNKKLQENKLKLQTQIENQQDIIIKDSQTNYTKINNYINQLEILTNKNLKDFKTKYYNAINKIALNYKLIN